MFLNSSDNLAMVDIIIVNWNSRTQLRECLNSIIQYGKRYINKIVVVDNGSTDDSLENIDSMNLPLVVIRNITNLGFAVACNQGSAVVSSNYLLFLNPDTRLFENSLLTPLSFMQNSDNSDIGIVGIQLVDEYDHIARSCSRFPTLSIFSTQALGINRLPMLQHFTQSMIEWSHDTTQQVDQVIGAFFLIRRSLFESLGGFDERFFVYFEEVDLSLRSHQAGWRTVYLTDTQAFHAGGGTSKQVKAKRLFYSLRSRILYVFKHFNLFSAVVVLFITLFVEPLSRSILAISRCSWLSLKETWQAYSMLFRWLPEWIFKGVTR